MCCPRSSGAGATRSVSLPWRKLSPSRSLQVVLNHFLCRVGLCAHCPSFVLGISFWLVQALRVTVWEFIYEPVCSVVSGKCCFLKLMCDPYRSYFLPPRLSSQIPKSWMEGCDRTPLRLIIRLWVMYWSMVRAVSVMRNHFSSCSLGKLQWDISTGPVTCIASAISL